MVGYILVSMDVWARRGHFYLCLCLGQRDTHFVALRHLMATCISRVDRLSMDPRVWGVTWNPSDVMPFSDSGRVQSLSGRGNLYS